MSTLSPEVEKRQSPRPNSELKLKNFRVNIFKGIYHARIRVLGFHNQYPDLSLTALPQLATPLAKIVNQKQNYTLEMVRMR